MLIYERLNIAETTLDNLKDRLDVPHLARLIDANFYSYFPKMFLLKDEVSSLTRHSDYDRGKIADLEASSREQSQQVTDLTRQFAELQKQVKVEVQKV